MPILFLIRGLPGAGKSTLARSLRSTLGPFEADDYFMQDGFYEFDGRLVRSAHEWCKERVEDKMRMNPQPDLVVANTFSRKREMEDYLGMAKGYHYHVVIIDLFDAGCSDNELAARNTHKVKEDIIKRMRDRWEPLPPSRCKLPTS